MKKISKNIRQCFWALAILLFFSCFGSEQTEAATFSLTSCTSFYAGHCDQLAPTQFFTNTFTVNTNKSTYAPGENMTVSFAATIKGLPSYLKLEYVQSYNGSRRTLWDNDAWGILSGSSSTVVANTPGTHSITFYAQMSYNGDQANCDPTCNNYASGSRIVPYTVSSPASEPTCSLSYSPSTINSGGSSSLRWSSTNATSASFSCTSYACNGSTCSYNGSGRSGTITPNGSAFATWNDNGTGADERCTFTFTGQGGSKTCSASLAVNTVSVTPPPTCSISYSPSSITSESASRISWSSTNATSGTYSCTNYSCNGSTCSYNGSGRSGNLPSLNLSGSSTVWNDGGTGADERCTLNFTGPGGSTSCSSSLSISPKPPLPTCSVSYSPAAITSGTAATLNWSSTNATSASFSCTNYACSGSTCTYNGTGRSGSINTSGSGRATWNDNGTGADELCTFIFTGAGGSRACTGSLAINPPGGGGGGGGGAVPTPPTLSLSASPMTVTAGSTTLLTWNVQNAASCSASGSWNGFKDSTNGSHSQFSATLSPPNKTFNLECWNSAGVSSGLKSVTVTVNSGGGGGTYSCTNLPCGSSDCGGSTINNYCLDGSGNTVNVSHCGGSCPPTVCNNPCSGRGTVDKYREVAP